MPTSPKVSIIIPCYNDGQYIQEAVDSALNQTYENIEIIIVNDGSTDKQTSELLKKVHHPLVKILSIENSGPSVARNIAIEKATGSYILPLDADDKLHKRYVKKAVEVMVRKDDVGIVYCRAMYFGEKKGEMVLPPYSLESMFLDNVIFVSAMFRKSAWKEVGGFDPAMRLGMEDYSFWLSLIEKLNCNVHQINEILFYCRVKKESRTSLFAASGKESEVYTQLFYNHLDLFLKDNNMLHYINHRQSMKKQIRDYGKMIDESPALKIERFIIKKPILKKSYYFCFSVILRLVRLIRRR